MICSARFSFSSSDESSSSLSKASARDARRNAAVPPKSNALLREKEEDDGEEILWANLEDEDVGVIIERIVLVVIFSDVLRGNTIT